MENYQITSDKITIGVNAKMRFWLLLVSGMSNSIVLIVAAVLALVGLFPQAENTKNILGGIFIALTIFFAALILFGLLSVRQHSHEVVVITSQGITIEGRKRKNRVARKDITRFDFPARTADRVASSQTSCLEVYYRPSDLLFVNDLALSQAKVPEVEKAIKEMWNLS
jgi:hypothetical protein